MVQLLTRADDVLRQRRWTTENELPWKTFRTLVLIVIVFGMLYGAVMGSYGLTTTARLLQVVYSSVKVPLLLFATFSISLPSFYVVNMLFGLADDFRESVRALVATQAGVAIVLASFAPFTALWYATSSSYTSAILVNAVMFGTASLTGQWLMRRYYEPLIRRNRRHRVLVWTWIFLYSLIGIQMGWILRPFIGSLNTKTEFIRITEWTNAYVVIADLIWRAIKSSF